MCSDLSQPNASVRRSGASRLAARGLIIRPYCETDRAAVRRICFETGYMGHSIEWLYDDASSFANLSCNYYTDLEPGSAFVAELNGEVAGYLLGCVDSRRLTSEVRRVARALLGRGLLHKRTLSFYLRGLVDRLRDDAAARALLDVERFPSHLHLNLRPIARGHGAGGALLEAFCAHARRRGSAGVHVETFFENVNARAFFARHGFVAQGRAWPAPGVRSRSGARLHVQRLVRALGAADEELESFSARRRA